MSAPWPMVKLGEVLRYRKEFSKIDDLKTYRRPRVQLHAQGIVQRDDVPGALIKTKQQQVCRTGELLVAEIDAKVGGYGVVPPALDGAIVSSHYFLYAVCDEILDRRFLDWFVHTPAFHDQVQAQGSTNYAAIRPADVLDYSIPLPPLAEQRRIVARIETLAAKVAEARGLRQEAVEKAEAMFEQARVNVFSQENGIATVPLQEVATLERGRFLHRPRNEPRFFGGTHPWIQIGEIERSQKYIRQWSTTLNDDGLAISKKFRKGTILVSIAATIGAVGILDFDCCVPDSIVGIIPSAQTDSEFLFHFLGYIREHLEVIAPQSAQKNINLQILARMRVPRLPLVTQRRIVTYLDGVQAKVDALKALQAETAAELAALLPAILDRAFKGEL
ncbi:MAG: restriction endonuclease subunit S [Candidatus Lambdaproteobacteria bacterium]|nr:restriction endonuclease subunit S [Candidatus Lambdaproteobacteria bacterium]